MAEVLDDLDGVCPSCGSGPVLIAGAGVGVEQYWAYCDRCNGMSCFAKTPDGVQRLWDAMKRRVR